MKEKLFLVLFDELKCPFLNFNSKPVDAHYLKHRSGECFPFNNKGKCTKKTRIHSGSTELCQAAHFITYCNLEAVVIQGYNIVVVL